jgi:hypothetical protein
MKTVPNMAVLLVAYMGGCAAQYQAHQRNEHPKIRAIVETLDALSVSTVGRNGVTSVSYFVSIAPAPPNPASVSVLIFDSKPYEIDYDQGTIGRANAATIVQREWSGERLAGVHTEVRYWDAGRWVTDDEYLRRRYPREMAQIDKVLGAVKERRSMPSTQPATRPLREEEGAGQQGKGHAGEQKGKVTNLRW